MRLVKETVFSEVHEAEEVRLGTYVKNEGFIIKTWKKALFFFLYACSFRLHLWGQ